MKRMVPTEQIDLLARLAAQGVTPERIAGIEADVGDTQKMIADEYDATATYAVGDVCIHDGKLYQCNTAIGTAEAWTAAHWTEVQVPELVKPIYWHTVKFQRAGTAEVSTLGRFFGHMIILSNSATPINLTTFLELLSTPGFVGVILNGKASVNGAANLENMEAVASKIIVNNDSTIDVYGINTTTNVESIIIPNFAKTIGWVDFTDLGANLIN